MMSRRRFRFGIAGAAVVAVAAVAAAQPAAAALKPVLGSAYGHYASVSFFGGTPKTSKASPKVKLPKGGSATPITASAPSGSIVLGPATFLTSGPVAVSTQGTSGSAMSSASLQSVMAGPFNASSVADSCTANHAAPTGSTTISGGTLVTATDTSGNPTTTVNIPANPPIDYSVSGYLYASPTDKENFTWVFNEQITNTNGSVTVNAAHEELMGPTAVGNMILGSATCRD